MDESVDLHQNSNDSQLKKEFKEVKLKHKFVGFHNSVKHEKQNSLNIRRIFTSNRKSNNTNAIRNFYITNEELVAKLDYFNPNPKNSQEINLFTLKKPLDKENIIDKFNIENGTDVGGENKRKKLNKEKDLISVPFYERRKEELTQKLKEAKENRSQQVIKVNNLQKEMENLSVEIDFINNYDYFFDDEFIKKKYGFNELLKEKKNLVVSYERRIQEEKFNEIYKNVKQKNKEDLISKKEEVEGKKLQLIELRDHLKIIEVQIENYKVELTQVKEFLITYYHKILMEGDDIRSDGFAWVISAIWSLDVKVLPEYIPNFLDEKLIFYLFTYAKKYTEIKKLYDELEFVKNNIFNMVKRKKEIAETKILYDTKNRTFQTELDTDQMEINKNLDDNNNKIKKRGRHLEKLKEFYDKHNKKLEEYKINVYLNNIDVDQNADLENDILEMRQHSIYLQKRIDKLRIDMEHLKKNEMLRINDEFLRNNYERRFNVSLETIIGIICGKDDLTKEMNRLMSINNKYLEKIQKVKNYSPYIPETGIMLPSLQDPVAKRSSSMANLKKIFGFNKKENKENNVHNSIDEIKLPKIRNKEDRILM